MEKIMVHGKVYEIIEGNEGMINLVELEDKMTDYFDNYDYVFGDYSYEKVRLKGFNDSYSKGVNSINDIQYLEEYKKEYCSYGAKTFLIKKVTG